MDNWTIHQALCVPWSGSLPPPPAACLNCAAPCSAPLWLGCTGACGCAAASTRGSPAVKACSSTPRSTACSTGEPPSCCWLLPWAPPPPVLVLLCVGNWRDAPLQYETPGASLPNRLSRRGSAGAERAPRAVSLPGPPWPPLPPSPHSHVPTFHFQPSPPAAACLCGIPAYIPLDAPPPPLACFQCLACWCLPLNPGPSARP